ncbi:MAG: type II secretion system protein [Candidatus Gastranaerophilales bacterium]|nr:type II secretion system protein [Candidatus Gastranaerophilales bacterium]
MQKIYKKKGFSFIEAIMAIVIMATVSLFLIASIPSQYSLSQDSQDLANATDIAQRYIEQVKLALADPITYENTSTGTTPPVAITSNITANGYFDVQTDVKLWGPEGREDSLKQISVIFSNAGNNNLLIQLSTVISKPDPRL